MTHAFRSSIFQTLFPLAAALALAACGGGGTGGTQAGALRVTKGAIASTAGGVTVNGVQFDASTASVKIEDQPGHLADLKPGMVVKVKGTSDDRTGTAAEIESEDAVRGKVAGTLGSTLHVGEQEIQVEDATEFEDGVLRLASIAPGDRVRVSGVPTASGAIRATRVDKDAGAGEDFEVKGYVSGLSMGPPVAFTLKVTPDAASSFAVTLADGVALPAGVANGSFVEVRSAAAPAGGTLTALAVQLEDASLGAENDEAEIEGVVSSGDGASFLVDGQAVVTDGNTRWENGVFADLVPGVKVEAEGTLDAQGVLHASKVSFRSSIRLQGDALDVSAQDARHGSFSLLGITVHVDDLTEWQDWQGSPLDLTGVGAGPVLVRGTLQRNGTDVVATRVERTNDTRPVLQGTVSSKAAAAGTLAILGITVLAGPSTEYRDATDAPISASAFFDAVVEGRTVVKARGQDASALSGTTLAAKQLEIEGSR